MAGGGSRDLNEGTSRFQLTDFHDELTREDDPHAFGGGDTSIDRQPLGIKTSKETRSDLRTAANGVLGLRDSDADADRQVRRFRLRVVEGSRTGEIWESDSASCAVGSHPINDLVLDDATVSRFHCEVRIGADGARIIDLKSCNGTLVDGVRVTDAFVQGGSTIRLGRTALRFEFGTEINPLPVSDSDRFGTLVSSSIPMRTAFALLERAAASDSTVLLQGGTGTGKGAAAESIHRQSRRAERPFVVIDCSALSRNLLESELFGHEKGAFTGAGASRVGAFEAAEGGTVFLDEIGEFPLDLQPTLLRVLENREIRRVGSNTVRPVDVRVIAATNRDLRSEVNEGRFRSDLYYRLAVLQVRMPLLRERPEDIPVLARVILESLGAGGDEIDELLTPQLLGRMERGDWPGNVRELRNYLEHCLVMEAAPPIDEDASGETPVVRAPVAAAPAPAYDFDIPFSDMRKQVIADFEQAYIKELLDRHDGKVAKAAKSVGLGRVHLYRLIRKYE